MSDQSWTEPGAFEVLPGVFRIPLPLPSDVLRAVNVYAIVEGDGVVLIDGGWALAESEAQLTSALGGLGFGLADIRDFLVTHVHRDHYTQAVAIRRAQGTRVSLGEHERPSLERIIAMIADRSGPAFGAGALARAGAFALRDQVDREFANFDPDPNWELPDRWLASDDVLPMTSRELRVIATPGHTTGHVVFLDAAAGALFAGDHVLPHITPSIGLEPQRTTMPLGDYLGSLALVRSLPDTVLLPAHGPVGPSVHARVDELLAHHEARLIAIAAQIDAGASTGHEAATRMTWTRRERRLDELDSFNQMLATTETLAHLDVLVARGWLHVETDADGVAHFAR